MTYTIEEHKHRFAAWAASRAASVSRCRFTVEQGKSFIEAVGIEKLLTSPEKLPSPEFIDDRHREWREKVIGVAQKELPNITHGVAAKLINMYLKAGFVCGGHHNHVRVQVLHPPIDSLLLERLSENNIGGLSSVWNKARKIRWSKFDSEQYETVINSIRVSMGDKPLWEVERYWPGHQ
jgi:hypothetical protein